jgi:hypothetical protein
MTDRVRRVGYFYFDVEDKPGEGARVLGQLKDAQVNLLAFTAFPTSGGRAQITVVPENAEALQSASRNGRAEAFREEGVLPRPGERSGGRRVRRP